MRDVHPAQLLTPAGVNFNVLLLSQACRQAGELYHTKA